MAFFDKTLKAGGKFTVGFNCKRKSALRQFQVRFCSCIWL